MSTYVLTYQPLFVGGGQSQEDRRIEESLDELKRDKARSDQQINQIQAGFSLEKIIGSCFCSVLK